MQYVPSTNELAAMWGVTALVATAFIAVSHRLVEIEAEEQELKRVEREIRWRASMREVEEGRALRAALSESLAEESLSDCASCCYYHGVNYYGNRLVCAMHPSGLENCPDWEPRNGN